MDDSRAKGREEGREEGKGILIINMLKENLPMDIICRVAECDESFAEQVKDKM